MIKVEHVEVFNFEGAIRGCRNAMNSWSKSDSKLCKGKDFDDCTVDCVKCPRKDENFDNDIFCIGKADLDLMHRLYIAGQPHRKYLRQLFVSMDITAPTYWLAELDTYRVGMTRNSCSFMHKGLSKPFELSDFSTHGYDKEYEYIIDKLNDLRDRWLETKDNELFQQIRCLLPSGYNQRSTYTMNYENVVNIIEYRTGHRLSEWNEFVDILWELPYMKEIAGEVEE